MYFTPGVFRRLSENLWIGAGVPLGLNADSAGLAAMVSLVYDFNAFPVWN
jgi:hypothetical protein